MKKIVLTLVLCTGAFASFGGAGNVYFSNIKSVTSTARMIPEPSAIALGLLGLALFGQCLRRAGPAEAS